MTNLINEQELRRIIRQMVQEEVAYAMKGQGVFLTEQQLKDAGINGLSSKQPNAFSKVVLEHGQRQHEQRVIEDKKKESIDI